MPDEEQRLAAGTEIGGYVITRLVGTGGMGSVYEAHHTDLGKRVAIKVMLAKFAAKEEMLARFRREGQAAARIRHPHVVDVFDVGVHAGLPYLVMEFLEGEDLGSYLATKGVLDVPQAVDLMLPVLSALAAAHEANVVHRDLKPENIFLAQDHAGGIHPKVLDFGISKLLDPNSIESLGKSTAILGTPYYMSPEQTRSGRTIDVRTDQYSAAVVLYRCVTGSIPFRSKSLLDLMEAIMKGDAMPPSAHRGDLPVDFDTVVMRAMHKDPDARYATIPEFALALMPFAEPQVRDRWSADFRSPRRTSVVLPTDDVRVRDETFVETGDFARAVGRGRRPTRYALIAAAVLIATGGALWLSRRGTAVTTAHSGAPAAGLPPVTTIQSGSFHVRIAAQPGTAVIDIDGRRVGVGTFEGDIARDGTVHRALVRADGYETQALAFRDEAPPSEVALVPRSSIVGAPPSPAEPPTVTHAPTTVLRPAGETTDPVQQSPRGANGAPILN